MTGLAHKYKDMQRDYCNVKVVNDLIYNEETHMVSIFKDYLIHDDINEFFKRRYIQQEVNVRLPKLCEFYDKYSQVFPNFIALPESNYMFKNIQKKQKLIDDQFQQKKSQASLCDDDRLFSQGFINSLQKRQSLSLHDLQESDTKSGNVSARQEANQSLQLSMSLYKDNAFRLTQGGTAPHQRTSVITKSKADFNKSSLELSQLGFLDGIGDTFQSDAIRLFNEDAEPTSIDIVIPNFQRKDEPQQSVPMPDVIAGKRGLA
jgi:hypothetical protein